jgi:hypothetical protein
MNFDEYRTAMAARMWREFPQVFLERRLIGASHEGHCGAEQADGILLNAN